MRITENHSGWYTAYFICFDIVCFNIAWFPVVLNGFQWDMAREETAKAQDRFGAIAFEGNIDTGCMNAIKRLWGVTQPFV